MFFVLEWLCVNFSRGWSLVKWLEHHIFKWLYPLEIFWSTDKIFLQCVYISWMEFSGVSCNSSTLTRWWINFESSRINWLPFILCIICFGIYRSWIISPGIWRSRCYMSAGWLTLSFFNLYIIICKTGLEYFGTHTDQFSHVNDTRVCWFIVFHYRTTFHIYNDRTRSNFGKEEPEVTKHWSARFEIRYSTFTQVWNFHLWSNKFECSKEVWPCFLVFLMTYHESLMLECVQMSSV